MEGYTPLFIAVDRGHASCVVALLRGGAALRRLHGMTPLHLAARGGYCDCAAILLRAGADPLSVSDNGLTPLRVCETRCRAEKAQVENALRLLRAAELAALRPTPWRDR